MTQYGHNFCVKAAIFDLLGSHLTQLTHSTTAVALSTHQLSWHSNKRPIISGVNIELSQGKMLGVIGPNGAGKSTLLRCLYRYLTPSHGQIFLFGQPIAALSAKKFAQQVAVVLQDAPERFDMSVSQLVALGLTPHKGLFSFTNQEDHHEIYEALATVGLTELAHRPYDQLSGGEKQRVLIARAIVQKPKLLILDEPTNHLDIHYQIQILMLLRKLEMTVIISIHDLNLAGVMCDQLLLLEHGKVVAQGTPNQVLTEEQISKVFKVQCQISSHSQHGKPQINYCYHDNEQDIQQDGESDVG